MKYAVQTGKAAGDYTKVAIGKYQVLIWFLQLLRYQQHAIWAASPSPDTSAAQSKIEPRVHSALGVHFFACP
jgi:hypothetical protein